MSTSRIPLYPFWLKHGAVWSAGFKWPLPDHFGDIAGEYRTLTGHAVLFDLSHRGRVEVSGQDRVNLLHNVLTQDIKALRSGESARALLLSAQGKCLADFRVFVFQDRIILDTEPGLQQESMALLDKYIIADDVTLRDITTETCLLTMEGPLSGECSLSSEVKNRFTGVELVRLPAGFSGEAGLGFLIPNSIAEVLATTLLGENTKTKPIPAGFACLDQRRIELGIVRFKQDFDEDTLLPETGLEIIAASGTKGCYPGQEVVARIETYGGLKKRIFTLSWPAGYAFSPGTILMTGAHKAGRITSGTLCCEGNKMAGLAILDLKAVGEAQNILSFADTTAAASLTVTANPA